MNKKRYSWIFISLILCSLLLFTSCDKLSGSGLSLTKKKTDPKATGTTIGGTAGSPPTPNPIGRNTA